MSEKTPASELKARMASFCRLMDEQNPEWQMAMIFSKVNLLYFTGSMSEGMLVIERDNGATYWVRRSYERALHESEFASIKPMGSYRDAAADYNNIPKAVYLETEFVPLAMFKRVQKYFPFETFKPLDFQLSMTRAVKSAWELNFMEQAGKIHQRVLEEKVPALLREGMSEADLAAELYEVMVKEGHHGTARFAMLDTDIVVAQLGFGTSSLIPTNFDGPGGNRGLNAAVPSLGNRERKLKKGDLVFVDMGLGVNGYHSDKTMTYMFGAPLSAEVQAVHQQCVDIQNRVAAMLKPGNTPEFIYETIMDSLTDEFKQNFMGFGNRQVKFLGHGIGLTVDELPVLAKGFKMPLQENMVFAVEPKKGIEGVGMVGIENSFLVTPDGGRSISGTSPGLILV
ncbi:M24 family metallopeptidase [Mangrovibacterium diazotrophicum]|uniref:Xaa-Pro aminopeptidase n=1 Tax=Mangrovibacterium diazotrophicum TaxID=1261403 RepID=A0A419W4V1_9BACT|nr:Xaa-Pro peptidase family protein [Mangrovibacterium diazotrophicum]RKD90479.1 Xaa-Pro aminopeptidase [Mangrovibacterium diazotrophicum]